MAESLPGPVRRYLRYAIGPNAPAVRNARMTHGGFFRTKPDQRWFPIRGEEHFTADVPGFVWVGKMRVAPLIDIVARDSLQSGRGKMLVKVCSVFPIANASGPEMDQGARLRWLAEAVWFPDAFAGDLIRWEAVDDRFARATLAGGGPPVTMLAEFENARLVGLSAERNRDTGRGGLVLTRWIGKCGEYREFGGFRIPASVEVGWEIDGREFWYARFRVREIEYNVERD